MSRFTYTIRAAQGYTRMADGIVVTVNADSRQEAERLALEALETPTEGRWWTRIETIVINDPEDAMS